MSGLRCGRARERPAVARFPEERDIDLASVAIPAPFPLQLTLAYRDGFVLASSNRAVVDESTALLVEPSDPAALGAAIAALVDRPALRASLGAAARARAACFSLERRAARILALLGDVVAAR